MTIIESFEKKPKENLLSTLTANPDKVIFIGDVARMKKTVEQHQRFLQQQGVYSKIEYCQVITNNLNDIVEKVINLALSEDDCVFDITGGEDLVILGIGIAYERLKNKKPFKLQRFNINTGKIIDCDGDNEVSFEGKAHLSVEELISLYGGTVVPSEIQPLHSETSQDIDILWEIVRKNNVEWNKSVSVLKEFEAKCEVKADSLHSKLYINTLKRDIANFNQKYSLFLDFLSKLLSNEIIKNLRYNNDFISYDYKNELVKNAFSKSGDILEMKTFFEARDLTKKDEPYFNDCYLSVLIDWDGVLHSRNDIERDTRNEIDVMLMRGLVPVFISCKNGNVDEEELYKLNTVAQRFGGQYARKALFVTDYDTTSLTGRTFAQRSKDMGIEFFPCVGKFTKKDWEKAFKKIIP